MNGSVPVAFKPAKPDQPGAITPTTSTLCINGTAGFSIAAVSRTTSYTWSAPGGTVVSGQGTTNVQITFGSSGNPITVSVVASNECGTSTARTIDVNIVAPPSAPTDISYNPALCVGNNYTFSVTATAGFTYEWSIVGTNFQILSSATASSVNVQVGSGTGTIKVKAVNSTGCKSAEYSEQVSGESTSPVYNVSGNGSICPGASTTIYLDNSASGYTYTAYRNDQGITGEAPGAVIVLSGNNSPLTFGPFTQEGTYTIKSSSINCPVTMNGSVPVAFKPAKPDQPGAISGTINYVCHGSSSTFSIASVDRATSYTWSGGTVLSGQGGIMAQLAFFVTSGTATVAVTANNECGSSQPSNKYVGVTYVSTPVFLASYPNPCAGGNYTFGVTPVIGYTYSWEVPSGWEILGGQGSSSIGVKAGRYDGTIKVKAQKNGCSSSEASLFVDIIEPPGVFGLTGSQTICEGGTFSLNLSGSAIGYDYSLMRGETTVTTKPGTNGSLTFGPFTTPGTYKVYSSLSGGCVYPMDGEAIVTTQTASVAPVSIYASALETCVNENVILTVFGGIPGKGAAWKWYSGSCGGIFVGSGSQISVKPSSNTVYFVRAEGTCNVTACASVSISVVSNCLNRQPFNYVRVRTTQRSGFLTLPVNASPEDIKSEYSYFDGIGRPSQSFFEQGSPLKRDILNINVYDVFGRERISFLPATINLNSGMPLVDPVTAITNFYNLSNPSHPANVVESNHPFSEKIIEPSPLNRITEQGAPGAAWQPGTGHTITRSYEFNAATDVLLFNYDLSTGTLSLSNSEVAKYYQPNQLYANRTIDEQGNDVVEYIDKEGRTVCKKVKASSTEYACTYYIYDDFGNLVVVMPPEAVKKITQP